MGVRSHGKSGDPVRTRSPGRGSGGANFPHEKRLLDDDVVYRFLPFAGKLLVTLARFPPVRSLLISLSEGDSPGIWGEVLRRKRYIDDKVADALKAGFTTVVNLGTGWDTRAYRLPSPRSIQVFEVDLPETIEAKRVKLLRVYGRIPENVTLVPIDFDRQNLDEVLRSLGYRLDEKTFFIWEAVTMYLTEAGVRRTLAGACPGAAGEPPRLHLRSEGLPRRNRAVRAQRTLVAFQGERSAVALWAEAGPGPGLPSRVWLARNGADGEPGGEHLVSDAERPHAASVGHREDGLRGEDGVNPNPSYHDGKRTRRNSRHGIWFSIAPRMTPSS